MRGYDFPRLAMQIYAFLCRIDLRIKIVSQNTSGLIGIKRVDRKLINHESQDQGAHLHHE